MFELVENPIADSDRLTFQRLLQPGGGPKFVLGRNKYAESVARVVDVEAFVDDFTNESTYLGRPIIPITALPTDSLVVSCVVDGRPVTALDRLRSAQIRSVIDYFTVHRLGASLFKPIDYCERNRADIAANLSEYRWVHDCLADEISKESFQKVIQFRYTFDVEVMRGFSLRLDEQYFEDFLPLRSQEVFVDGGGYDGDTSLRFAARAPDYRNIYYFEPSPEMMSQSKRRLEHLRDVNFFQKGLFSRAGTCRFDADAGSASRISDSGKNEIQTTTLDMDVPEEISFIKLDIEGAEFEAINGAAGHIKCETPKIAVCVYHDQSDFWRIPRRVLAMNSRYEIFLRHYSEGILETVMFFIPRS